METIKVSEGSEVSVSPERGGIITSIKLRGTEILYLDQETFDDKNVNVRGGIPILFPNAGAIESERYPLLKQHGFARNSFEWIFEKNDKGFVETLISSDETKKLYPYDFKLSVEGKFEENGSFTITQTLENLEEDKELPIAMGLHPYFKVSNGEKKNIKFNFEGGKYIEENSDLWMNGQYISINNPKVMEVVIPNLGTLTINVSSEYQKIWIWSLPEKDFICIEPVMRDVGGLIHNPQMIKPKETFTASINFNLK